MNTEQRSCKNCSVAFAVEPTDFDFYKKMAVPPPTWCPECRLIRRMSFRNERHLYKRKCDLCGQDKIMMYPAEVPFPVYCRECWWSDNWDAKTYGIAFDPNRQFLDQLIELGQKVPRPSVIRQGNIVDSDYTNRVGDQRNSYLVFGSNNSEHCRYGVWMNDCKECMDSYGIQKCERCYECVDCFQCSRLKYSQECNDCSDSAFLYNCRNCQDCFGCVNLRNKRFCIWNEQYSKEEYQAKMAALQLGNSLLLEGLRAKFDSLKRQAVVPALVAHHNTKVSGNWIENCKNTFRSFSCTNLEDARYCLSIIDSKDVMDYTFWGLNSEKIYEVVNCGRQCANLRFANECWDQVIDAEYVMNCHSSHDLFGCIGIRKGEYCILNKQYPKEEFEKLTAQIRQSMDNYGEFLPAAMTTFAYNETIAQEFFPLPKETILAKGLKWKEDTTRNYRITIPAAKVPDVVSEVSDDIVKEIIGCSHGGACSHNCTTAFRIISEELAFYRTMTIPLPKLCPNCRHFERLARRNPLKLWPRKCQCSGAASQSGGYKNSGAHFHEAAACPNEFETSYATDRPEIVYCEQCYQAEVA